MAYRPLMVRDAPLPGSWRLVLFLDGGNAWQPVDRQYVMEVAALFRDIRVTVCDHQPTHMWEATYLWCRVAPLDYRPGVTGTAPLRVTDPARLTPQVPNMCYAGVHHPLIVAHEVGHMLGLDHTDEPNRVMSTQLLGPRWSAAEKMAMKRTAVRYCDYWFKANPPYPQAVPAPPAWEVAPVRTLAAGAGLADAGIVYKCPWGQ